MDTNNTNNNGMGDLIAMVLLAGLLGKGNIPPGFNLGKHPTHEADPTTDKELEKKLKELNYLVAGALQHMDVFTNYPGALDMEISRICTIANDISISCKIRSELAKENIQNPTSNIQN